MNEQPTKHELLGERVMKEIRDPSETQKLLSDIRFNMSVSLPSITANIILDLKDKLEAVEARMRRVDEIPAHYIAGVHVVKKSAIREILLEDK